MNTELGGNGTYQVARIPVKRLRVSVENSRGACREHNYEEKKRSKISVSYAEILVRDGLRYRKVLTLKAATLLAVERGGNLRTHRVSSTHRG